MGSDLNLFNLICSYAALIVTIVGCEMFFSYLVASFAPECTEENELINEDGSITFNPFRYFDVLGTIVFPLVLLLFSAPILFGWSKSLWVNLQKIINHYGLNMAILLSFSAVFFHFFVAFLASILISWIGDVRFDLFFEYLVICNIFFVVIKLCPILPYDGLRILSYIALKFGSDALLRFYAMLIPYGTIILVVIVLTPMANLIFTPVRLILNFLL